MVIVSQSGGVLEISSPRQPDWRGGVNESGRFHAGAENNYGDDSLRTLWEGRFGSNSFTYARRDTALRRGTLLNTVKTTGTAQRAPCNALHPPLW